MKEKLMASMLVITMVIFFVGLIMMGYGMTSEMSYTETMQNVMGYGAIALLVGLVGFITTLIADNVKTV